MALRYHHQSRRQQSLFSGAIGRIVAVLIAVLALLTLLALVLVNGATIRGPLASLLSDRINATVTIEDAEFSPLYPDTIKLTGITVSAPDFKGVIDEAYVEIDLRRSLFSDTLYVDDLYLNAPEIDLGPLLEKTATALPYAKTVLTALRLDNLPLDGEYLKAQNARLRFQAVTLEGGGRPHFATGTLKLEEGSVMTGLPFKSLELTLEDSGETLQLPRFSGQLWGGTVSGAGVFDKESRTLNLSELNLSQNILKTGALSSLPLKVHAAQGHLSSVMLSLTDKGTLLSGLTGSFDSLKLLPKGLSLSFKGTVEEISHPESSTVLTDSTGELSLKEGNLKASLTGRWLEGDYTLKAGYREETRELNVEELTLTGNKLEIGATQLKPLTDFLKTGRINLEHVRLENIALLSFIDRLPLSAEALTLSLDGFSLNKDGLHHHPTGVFNVEAGSVLLSDLYIERVAALGTLDDNLLTLSVPQLTFREGSSLTLSGTLSRLPDGQSFIYALARDFDVSALNSRLLPHLFAGKVSLELSLSSAGNTPDALIRHLTGKVSLSSDTLLISGLGFDLINGGDLTRHELDLTELLTALSVSDGGFYDTSLQLTFGNAEGRLRGSTVLPTAEVYVNHRLNLEDLTLAGRSLFTSPSHDSVTHVTLSGTLKDPRFSLRPQKRGERRPGISLSFNAPAAQDSAEPEVKETLPPLQGEGNRNSQGTARYLPDAAPGTAAESAVNHLQKTPSEPVAAPGADPSALSQDNGAELRQETSRNKEPSVSTEMTESAPASERTQTDSATAAAATAEPGVYRGSSSLREEASEVRLSEKVPGTPAERPASEPAPSEKSAAKPSPQGTAENAQALQRENPVSTPETAPRRSQGSASSLPQSTAPDSGALQSDSAGPSDRRADPDMEEATEGRSTDPDESAELTAPHRNHEVRMPADWPPFSA